MDAPVFALAKSGSQEVEYDLKVEFAQISGYKTAVKYEYTGNDSNMKFNLKFGKLGICDQDLFEEFNPMKEVDAYGKANPFQDPAIGRVPGFTTFDDGSYSSYEAVFIEQNLLGPLGIVGRTLWITADTDMDQQTDDELLDCWVIGLIPGEPAPWNGDAPPKPIEEEVYEKPARKGKRNRRY